MSELMREITSPTELSDAFRWAAELIKLALPGRVALFVGPPRRSKEANDKMWPMLRDVARQVPWNGVKLQPEDWKDLVTAALKRQKLVPGLDGGLVVLGGHTSKMTVDEMSELIEFVYSWGSDRDVVWSEKSQTIIKAEQERIHNKKAMP